MKWFNLPRVLFFKVLFNGGSVTDTGPTTLPSPENSPTIRGLFPQVWAAEEPTRRQHCGRGVRSGETGGEVSGSLGVCVEDRGQTETHVGREASSHVISSVRTSHNSAEEKRQQLPSRKLPSPGHTAGRGTELPVWPFKMKLNSSLQGGTQEYFSRDVVF